ncbi:MAG: DUF72 domain-containing protein [Acidimicrobiales bacterium]
MPAPETAGARPVATGIQLDGARVLVGTCSWTDATLVKETDWYPKRSMTAAERLACYASRFPLVEVDSTYYFPPTPEMAQSWAERTPTGFTMNIKAWSLLTGHPTFPHSLWPDLQAEVPAEHRDKRRLYAHHLPTDVFEEAWDRFRHALSPLHEAGRLGCVLLQFPRWFGPLDSHRRQVAAAVTRLGEYRACVEFRHARWLEGAECERTLTLLEDLGAAYTCVDEPAGFASSMPPVVAATTDFAVVRFHGRNAGTWETPTPTAAERFRYLYSPEELAEWVPKVRELAASAREVHLLMNNCYRDQAVVNAAQLASLLVV